MSNGAGAKRRPIIDWWMDGWMRALTSKWWVNSDLYSVSTPSTTFQLCAQTRGFSLCNHFLAFLSSTAAASQREVGLLIYYYYRLTDWMRMRRRWVDDDGLDFFLSYLLILLHRSFVVVVHIRTSERRKTTTNSVRVSIVSDCTCVYVKRLFNSALLGDG